MPIFTVFCRQSNDSGTTHINTVEVEENDITKAAVLGRAECANDWEMRETEIKVIGVCEGSIQPNAWDDDGIEMPAPRVLKRIRIEINAFPGCDFTGAKFFDIEGEALDTQEEFDAAMVEPGDLLDDADIGDDPMGGLAEQVEKAVNDMLDLWEKGKEPKSKSLVLCAGRFKEDRYGDPTEEVEETFDITVDIVPLIEDASDD